MQRRTQAILADMSSPAIGRETPEGAHLPDSLALITDLTPALSQGVAAPPGNCCLWGISISELVTVNRSAQSPQEKEVLMTPKKMMEMPESQPGQYAQHGVLAKGFGQTFGILPSIALLTLAVDTMLFAGEIASMGLILPICCAAGCLLGLITFLAQRKHYGDDNEAALIKGLIVALVTAIPSPLSGLLSVPSGIVGFVYNMRRK